MTAPSSDLTGDLHGRSSLRRKVLAIRLAATQQQRAHWDRSIIDHLHAHLLLQPLRSIGAYWPIRNEADLRPLLVQLDEAGFEIGLPQVIASDAPLEFLRWRTNSTMRNGAFNIAVPDNAQAMTPELLLVPCVGFLTGGNRHFRLGYGGGYYDRTLAALPVPTIGVAYECSRLSEADGFEPQVHDVDLDRMVTEAGII